MKKRRLSDQIATFVAAHIDSVHTLEVLLLLQAERSRVWAVEEVHERVKSSIGAIRQSLLGLVATGLVKRCGSEGSKFQFSPKTLHLDDRILELAVAYSERSTAIVELIYSRPLRPRQVSSNVPGLRKRSDT